MKYKVLTSFSGAVSASTNSEISLDDEVLAKDLINAGYIEAIQEDNTTPETNVPENTETTKESTKKTTKKTTKKATAKDAEKDVE